MVESWAGRGLSRLKQKWPWVSLGLIFAVIFIQLGAWQLHHYEQKKQAQVRYHQLYRKPALALNKPHAVIKDYELISASGHYLYRHDLLLVNRPHQHRLGYEVLTPFILKGSRQLVLVNRGWRPLAKGPLSMAHLPVIPHLQQPYNSQLILGYSKRPQHHFFNLRPAIWNKGHWPLVAQAIPFSYLRDKLARPIYPFILYLDRQQPNGFIRQWKPSMFSLYENMLHVFVFFMTAAIIFLVLLYILFRPIKDRNKIAAGNKDNE